MQSALLPRTPRHRTSPAPLSPPAGAGNGSPSTRALLSTLALTEFVFRARAYTSDTMAWEKLAFEVMPWEPGAHPLERKKSAPGSGATLLCFEPGFEDSNVCTSGHAGYVLDGVLRLELEDAVLDIGRGEGFVLDHGTRHRAKNAGNRPVVLFIAPRTVSGTHEAGSRPLDHRPPRHFS